jgi:hypothetical protein
MPASFYALYSLFLIPPLYVRYCRLPQQQDGAAGRLAYKFAERCAVQIREQVLLCVVFVFASCRTRFVAVFAVKLCALSLPQILLLWRREWVKKLAWTQIYAHDCKLVNFFLLSSVTGVWPLCPCCTDMPFNSQLELHHYMKNAVFWDVTPCGSCNTYVSEELSASIITVTRIITANVPSSQILVTQMMEALTSFETSCHEPRGVTSQKAQFFIVTAVKTSNLTYIHYMHAYKSRLRRRVLIFHCLTLALGTR